VAVILFAIWCL